MKNFSIEQNHTINRNFAALYQEISLHELSNWSEMTKTSSSPELCQLNSWYDSIFAA